MPRELPAGSASEYLRRSMRRRNDSHDVVVAFAAPADVVAARLPGWFGTPEPVDDGSCVPRATVGDSLEWLAVRLALTGVDFTVRQPEELIRCARELGTRLSRAAGSGRADPSPP
ncbi:hypothetical protein GCM10010129_54610 [Streptomyces fumigatiscleroticus]|nr:hypothetical protein GCM10010129_54610 [Streptomyces fumigatiscleroticus]